MRIPLATFAMVTILSAAAGCSTAEEPQQENAPPTESRVFEASADTKSELGIARWGFDADPYEHRVVYRGYGEKNEVLATVVHKTEDASDRHVSTITMTGTTASASERIEYTIDRPEGGEPQLMMAVTENSFADGGVPLRVLARFRDDSTAAATTSTTSALLDTANLVTPTQLLEPSRDDLRKQCPSEQAYRDAMGSCAVELSKWTAAENAESNACTLLKRGVAPAGACVGAALAAFELTPLGMLGACVLAGGGTSTLAEQDCRDARSDNIRKEKKFDSCFRQFCPPSMRAR
jgi:hypothetical protein